MWFQFWKKKKLAPVLQPAKWLLVPLGNPGGEYACTRHNLGRLMVQRWMDAHCAEPQAIHGFTYGSIYRLGDGVDALVPNTYMNSNGKVVAEAVEAGLPLERMLVIYDDKDLPLGTGRLSKSGGSGGHRGLQGILDGLQTDSFLRLRLGIGPFLRPLSDWVLGEWEQEEWAAIEKMDAPFSRFLELLVNFGDTVDLQSRANAPAFWGQGR